MLKIRLGFSFEKNNFQCWPFQDTTLDYGVSRQRFRIFLKQFEFKPFNWTLVGIEIQTGYCPLLNNIVPWPFSHMFIQ